LKRIFNTLFFTLILNPMPNQITIQNQVLYFIA
jgi:hypothetical protein